MSLQQSLSPKSGATSPRDPGGVVGKEELVVPVGTIPLGACFAGRVRPPVWALDDVYLGSP